MSVDYSNNLYISVYGKNLIAGPGIVTAIKFLTLKQPGPIPNRGIRDQYPVIEEYLDSLEEDVDYLVAYYKIPIQEIEYKGFHSAASKRVIDLTARYSFNWKCKRFFLCSLESVGGLYFQYEYADSNDWRKAYCNLYSKYYQMFWMKKYYSILYPEYDLDKNCGLITNKHLDRILQIGPVNSLHRLDAFKHLSKRWLELLRQNDFWALNSNYYCANPRWWPRDRLGCNFIQCLTKKEQEEALDRFIKFPPKSSTAWLLKDLREDDIFDDYEDKLRYGGNKDDLETFLQFPINYKRGRRTLV